MHYGGHAIDPGRFIFMLARQRSGTNALRSVLSSHGELCCTPEIFLPEPDPAVPLQGETNYFAFLERHTNGHILPVLVSEEAQREVFVAFLEHLETVFTARYIVVDVKYNSTHSIDRPWRAIGEERTLFRLLRSLEIRALNITRRNYLRYYLSWRQANTTTTWTSGRADGDTPRVHVPLDEMTYVLEQCRYESDAVARTFRGYPHYLELEYDDLFESLGAAMAERPLQVLAEWLGIDERSFARRPEVRKLSARPLEDAIDNYREVEDRLRGTSLEYCLQDERMYRGSPAASG